MMIFSQLDEIPEESKNHGYSANHNKLGRVAPYRQQEDMIHDLPNQK